MPKIIYITSLGAEHPVQVSCGISAMEAAVQNGVPGIDGDCGGAAACATCHVWVDPAWIAITGPAGEGNELAMVSLAEGFTPNSRLACQIKITDAMDGLVLRMPADQH